MYLTARFPVGAGRAGVRVLMSRYRRTLIVCAPTLIDQWQRAANSVEGIELAEGEEAREVKVMSRDELLLNQPVLHVYNLIVIEDYPDSVHAPRRRFDGVSYLGWIKESLGTANIDILLLE